LGESSESAEPTRKPQKTEVLSSKSHNIIPIVLIFLGIVFLIACVAVFSYPYIIRFINKNKDE
jgi:cadmium resistance protein CadD (predicted permease)